MERNKLVQKILVTTLFQYLDILNRWQYYKYIGINMVNVLSSFVEMRKIGDANIYLLIYCLSFWIGSIDGDTATL